MTQFIANHKSRQEFKAFIGPLCEKAVLEPLHLKSNAVQKQHNQLLKLALAKSNLPANISSLTEIPECSIKRYLVALEVHVKATRLRKQLVKCIFEEREHDKNFTYCFTGKDSRLILHGFMHLVCAIKGKSTDVKLTTKLLIIVFLALKLRQSISLFSMYHFSEDNVERLHSVTSQYWSALSLLGDSPSPSEWSIGKIVAVHARWMFEKYGVGLGNNTMQGREAKHVHIATCNSWLPNTRVTGC